MQRSSNLGCQPTLEHACVQAAEWLVAGLPLSQALIQYRQRLTAEPRLCTLVILLRQNLSLNEPSGGGPIDDTCDPGTRWRPAAAEHPTSRHILALKIAPRKEWPRVETVRCARRPRVRSAHRSIGSVLTIENGSLFLIGITPAAVEVGHSLFVRDHAVCARRHGRQTDEATSVELKQAQPR